MYIGLHVKYRLFLRDFIETRIFLDKSSKNTHISNFMKIRPVWAELFFADGQTDMAKLVIGFRNFPNAAKDVLYPTRVYRFYLL